MKKKQAVRAVVFLALLFISLRIATDILMPTWSEGTGPTLFADEFYSIKKDTVEVGIIGSSQITCGLSSGRLLDKYGISAYSCATASQPVMCSYFYLKEMQRLQHVSTVIFETSMLYGAQKESRFRQTLDLAPMSINKLQLIWERSKSEDASDFFSYFFPIMEYHTRWADLRTKDIVYENNKLFWGDIAMEKVERDASYEELCVDNEEVDEAVQMNPDALAAFRMFADYCQKHNINLVMIKTPKIKWTSAETIGCQALADEYGLDYIDFNTGEMLSRINLDISNDIRDDEHLNIRGADKVTDYIGEYLLEHYEFEDFRESPDYDAEKMERYRTYHDNKFLQATIRVPEYLELLQDDRFEIMLQKTGDFSAGWDESLQKQMEQLGITTDLSALDGQYYTAQLREGAAIIDLVQAEPIEEALTLADDNSGAVRSDAERESDVIMAVSGHKYKFKHRGLNVLVYDRENHDVADVATLYINGNGALDIQHDIKGNLQQ